MFVYKLEQKSVRTYEHITDVDAPMFSLSHCANTKWTCRITTLIMHGRHMVYTCISNEKLWNGKFGNGRT